MPDSVRGPSELHHVASDVSKGRVADQGLPVHSYGGGVDGLR